MCPAFSNIWLITMMLFYRITIFRLFCWRNNIQEKTWLSSNRIIVSKSEREDSSRLQQLLANGHVLVVYQSATLQNTNAHDVFSGSMNCSIFMTWCSSTERVATAQWKSKGSGQDIGSKLCQRLEDWLHLYPINVIYKPPLVHEPNFSPTP